MQAGEGTRRTQEESNSLPTKSKSPAKRKQDDLKSESVPRPELQGGLSLLQSYKTKKKTRKKKDLPVTPPSSKSLLRQTVQLYNLIISVVSQSVRSCHFN